MLAESLASQHLDWRRKWRFRVITKKDFFAAENRRFLNGEKRPVNTGWNAGRSKKSAFWKNDVKPPGCYNFRGRFW